MGYGDYTPSGNHYKKPLNKKQLEKLRENFLKGTKIVEEVQKIEEKDKEKNFKNLENSIDSLFI